MTYENRPAGYIFKPGDKVRLLMKYAYTPEGSTGTVVRYDDNDSDVENRLIRVRLDQKNEQGRSAIIAFQYRFDLDVDPDPVIELDMDGLDELL